MSSLAKFIPRRTYRERAQPASRQRFGMLEKHKDYVLRAKAFHKKQDTLRILREKAANRNPDEFYFKMIRSRLVDGVHMKNLDAIPNEKHDKEMKILVKKIQTQKKKMKKINAELHSDAIFYTERKIDCTRKQLKESKIRLRELEKVYMDKTIQTIQDETQNKGNKHKLRERKH